jgi:hypothetical protein
MGLEFLQSYLLIRDYLDAKHCNQMQNRQRVTELIETYITVFKLVSKNTPLLGSSGVHFEHL